MSYSNILFNGMSLKHNKNQNQNIEHMCFFNCSGPTAKSTIKVENDVLTIDKQSVELLTSHTNNLIVNSMMNSSKSCGSGGNIVQSTSNKFGKIAGDFNVGAVKQTADISVDFSCVQSSEVKDQVTSEIMVDLMEGLESNTSQEATAIMNAKAASETSAGVGSSFLTAPTSSTSNIEMKNKFQNISDRSQKISNLVANSMTKNFTSNDIEDCRAQAVALQSTNNSAEEVGGSVKIGPVTQEAALKLVSNCIQNSNTSSAVANGLLSSMGITVKNTLKQKSSTDQEGSAESKAKAKGIEDIIDSIGKMLSSLFSGIFGAMMMPALIICGLLVFCCCSICAYSLYSSMSGKSEQPQQQSQQSSDSEQAGGFFTSMFRKNKSTPLSMSSSFFK